MKVRRLGMGFLLALGLAGCPSFSTLQTARALDRGQLQVAVAPEVFFGEAAATSTSTTAPHGLAILPDAELAARYGVADGFDLGLKLFPVGVELESTVQLVKGDAHGGLDLAFAPGIGYFGLTLGGSTNGGSAVGSFSAVPLYLPLLVGYNFGDGNQLVVGPKLIPYFLFVGNSGTGGGGGSGVGFELFTGFTLGVSFKLGSTLRIMPELDVFYPALAAAAAGPASGAAFGGNALVFQGALGFTFGEDSLGTSPKLPTIH